MSLMDNALEQFVRHRAAGVCEYCRLPQRFSRLKFSVDHVVARQHEGPTIESNLALACTFCNRHKGPNIAGIDPQTKQMVRLFDPRRDVWNGHFQWNSFVLIGKTEIGRATITVLAINHPDQLAIRKALSDEGEFPA
jgi:5-methylcytosine-specific restriction endonuclease McrA